MQITPSFLAHILNGILLLTAVILGLTNISKLKQMQPYAMIKIVLLFSLAVGIHGLSHLGMEYVYNYNPL
jgi:hypothetical protein